MRSCSSRPYWAPCSPTCSASEPCCTSRRRCTWPPSARLRTCRGVPRTLSWLGRLRAMSAPKITKVRVHQYQYELRDMGVDYNGFNAVYEPGARRKAGGYVIAIETDADRKSGGEGRG